MQKQVIPLETWIETKVSGPTILLGDFNRNLAHEINFYPAGSGNDP